MLESIRDRMKEQKIEALVITSLINQRYMTGFTGTNGITLISSSEAIFITDPRYEQQASKEISNCQIVIQRNSRFMLEKVVEVLKNMNVRSVGIEAAHMSYDMYAYLTHHLSIKFEATYELIEELRELKTDEELSHIKKAAQMTDEAFHKVKEFIVPGVKERQLANQLEFIMKDLGADRAFYNMTVASGVRGALPHGRPSDKYIKEGEMVTLDFGVRFNGYHADMTRTVSVGEPHEELKKIHNLVLEALKNCTDNIRAGMSGNDVDWLVRQSIDKEGYGEYFVHGSGHGLGLELHENPFFYPESSHKIKEGVVVTVEPGVYIPDLGGVRIEDDILITGERNEVLTNTPRHYNILKN